MSHPEDISHSKTVKDLEDCSYTNSASTLKGWYLWFLFLKGERSDMAGRNQLSSFRQKRGRKCKIGHY